MSTSTIPFDPSLVLGMIIDPSAIANLEKRAQMNVKVDAARANLDALLREKMSLDMTLQELVSLGATGAVPPSLGVVEGGEIPYKKEALAKRDENRANWITADPEVYCYLPGIPRATYLPYPFKIAQNDDALFFSYAYASAMRNVTLTDPGPAPIDSWMGQSWARWEGDTLVIETTGQNDRTWFDRAGNYHSDQLKVTERFTRTSDHTIDYSATMEDPVVFTKPWTINMPLYRRVGADEQILKFDCVEYVEEMMYGHLRAEPVK